MSKNLEMIATWDANEEPKLGALVDSDKLPTLYKDLRQRIFLQDPLQENSGNNGLVLHDFYQGHPQGNYGWQLFKTPAGTATLEYLGNVSYWHHERKPEPLDLEKHIRWMKITFHQEEPLLEYARRIVDEHIGRAKERLKAK